MKVTVIQRSKRDLDCTECKDHIEIGQQYGWWRDQGVHVACSKCLKNAPTNGTDPQPRKSRVLDEPTPQTKRPPTQTASQSDRPFPDYLPKSRSEAEAQGSTIWLGSGDKIYSLLPPPIVYGNVEAVCGVCYSRNERFPLNDEGACPNCGQRFRKLKYQYRHPDGSLFWA